MKKILLATTAVVALSASAAQAEINLDLGGFFKAYGGYASQDTDNVRKFDIARKSQIYFSGETTLDNGLTVGAHTELFGENNAGQTSVNTTTPTSDNSVEESYMYLSGNWGRVNVGRENGAAYLLQVSAPGADANIDGQDIDFSFFNADSTPTTGVAVNIDQDYQHSGPNGDAQYSDKITYLTPKFNGFQAGVTYTPSYEEKAIGANTNGMIANNVTDKLEDLMEVGARYDGEMNGVGIHAGAGYSTADQQVNTTTNDDYKEWNAGLKFDYNNFGFGGAYTTDNGSLQSDGDTDTYVLGADYTYGATKFGYSYFNSQGETGATTEDELDRHTLGAVYTYGPGMDFNASVALYDLDAASNADDNEATVFAVGTDVQF
jgi:outer membrane protein OmpU